MKALLLYPKFPQSFWSYDRFMEIAGLKATIPPLGIITVAALLPQNWEIRFYDRNVNPETEADWEWCELVILSAMLVQKPDFQALIQKAVQLGKKSRRWRSLPHLCPPGCPGFWSELSHFG